MTLRWAVVTYDCLHTWEVHKVPIPDDIDDAETWMHDNLGTLFTQPGAEMVDQGCDSMEPTEWEVTYGVEKGQERLL